MNYYNEIKSELINNEINRKVKNYSINKSDLTTYYNVGKMLSEAGKQYGESIIKNYSIKLVSEVDKKYNETNLKRMRQFYWKVEKGATVWHQLSWSHYRLLITLETIEEITEILENNPEIEDELEESLLSKYETVKTNVNNYSQNNKTFVLVVSVILVIIFSVLVIWIFMKEDE